jgi:hypothetical protein
MGEVKRDTGTGIVAMVDHSLGALADGVANWSIQHARDRAWTEAQALAALHDEPFRRDWCLVALACVVGFASRTLLVRTG